MSDSVLFEIALPYHKGFVHFLLLLNIVYLLLTQIGVKTKNYVVRIRIFLPLYNALLAAMAFSGLVLLAEYHFSLNYNSAKMILCLISLIALSIYSYKKLKKFAKEKNLIGYRKFALFKGILDILLVLIAAYL